MADRFASPGLRYGDVKKELFECFWNQFEPFRKKRDYLSNHKDFVLEKLKIGCGPINNIDAVFSDPQVNDRDMVIKMPHAALNGASVALVANPLRLSETAVSYRHPPPLLGEHTDEVLSEILGADEAEQKSLREAGVI